MVESRHDIAELQENTSKGLLVLIWLHLPLLAAIAALLGHDWLLTETIAAGLAGAATACWYLSGNSLETRLTVAVVLIGMVALIVNELSGNPWQIDSHMYFFAALAVLAAYCDWRVVLMAAVAIALHHLVLNFLLPAAIFPAGADFGRVVLHAVIVVLEAAVLIWLTHQLARLFDLSRTAMESAEAARQAETAAHAREAALAVDAETTKAQARQLLAQRFEADVGAMVRDVAAAAKGVHANAESLSGSASQTAGGMARIVDVSRGTTQSVQSVAAATEELSASVAEITGQIARAAGITDQAMRQARETGDTMKHLAEMAGRIETVVQLINGIAGQTNLLALNATIEAARAAEAGKGFAVVANEVKALATQTAKATEEIRGQIAAIQSETESAVGAIGDMTRTIADLGAITTAIAAAVEEQSAATAEIARSAQQAASGTEAISENLTTLAQVSSDTGSAAAASLDASGQLSAHCAKMTGSVLDFVGSMRAT
jgi:methyl-accepting chemotaxis protein